MKTGIFAAALAGCVASASGATIGDATYDTSTDVSSVLAISEQACAVKAALGEGDWAKVRTAYAGTVLQDAANSVDDNSYYEQYKEFFRDPQFIDSTVMHAIENTGDFAKMPGDSGGARAEATEKGAVDQIAVKTVMRYLLPVVGQTDAAVIVEHWDKAFTAYMGKDNSCAVYARAQKRASNYGTWSAADDKVAAANYNVLKAFADGAAAVGAKEFNKLEGFVETIQSNIQAIYIQASLRYLYLLDTDVIAGAATSDHQGEGMAFWRVISPQYDETPSAYQAQLTAVNVAYDLTKAPVAPTTRYCHGKDLFMNTLPTGVTAAMIGTFEHDAEWKCPEGNYVNPPPGVAAKDDDGTAKDDDGKKDDDDKKSDDDDGASMKSMFALPAIIAMAFGTAHMF